MNRQQCECSHFANTFHVIGNMMRVSHLIFILLFFTGFQSCNSSITEYADKWTNDIKAKITVDANQQPDKVEIDSSAGKVTLYKDGRKLKYFKLKVDDMHKHVPTDTVVSIFYSTDQNFELIREHCPSVSRSFEGIKWKGQPVGLAEFRFCNGKLMENGYRFYTDIGIWKKYDTSGKLVSSIDYHDLNRLKMLKEVKYYR